MRSERHGSPYDRGAADAWYGRPRTPHYYRGSTYASERVEEKDMTQGELDAYDAGYRSTPQGKDYGTWEEPAQAEEE